MQHLRFLTNSHVTKPSASSPEDIRSETALYGVSYSAPLHSPLTTILKYLAVKAFEGVMNETHSRINAAEERIKELETSVSQCKNIGRQTTSLEREKDDCGMLLSQGKLIKSNLHHLPFAFGKVLVSSGKPLGPLKSILDWSFVELAASAKNVWDNLFLTSYT